MTIQLSDLLRQIVSKKVDVLSEGRKKSMHSTSKASKEAEEAGKKLQTGETPETRGHRAKKEAEAQRSIELAKKEKARGLQKGTSEYEKAMKAAKAEFDKYDAERKLKKTSSDEPASGAAEDEGHRRALASAKRKAAKKAAKAPVSEETDAEHAKKLGRDIKRYEKGGNAAHQAALAAAKKREARKKGEK
jgi:colicin import membrane protein